MILRECTDAANWDAWASAMPRASFLQSWEWGEFQQAGGNAPLRFLTYEEDHVVGGFQGLVHQLPLGIKYLYVPGGDQAIFQDPATLAELKKRKLAFVRLEAFAHGQPEQPFETKGARTKPTHSRQPHQTMLLDLSQDLDTLLANMHSKTRYNIRLAERKGVHVIEEQSADVFWQLNEQTTDRGGFKSHSKEYYERFLQLPDVHQVTAYIGDTPIVSNLCLSYGDTFVYVHGASSSAHRNYMAPYLVQWQTIQHAKSLGFRYYDFWGVAPQVTPQEGKQATCFHNYCWDETHRFAGITRFKAGFGGTPLAHPEAMDIILQPLQYQLYAALHSILRR